MQYNFKKSPGGKILKMCESAKKCEKCRNDFAL